MAGSDLDGDLYFVTWHEALILKKENELPMHFPTADESQSNNSITESDIIEQIKFIVESDNTGRISRQHLIFADLNGIDSDECKRLADLSAQMYDAAKTGVVPEWPAELSTKKVPDFLDKDGHQENYESKRVLGKLYRHSKSLLKVSAELSKKHKCTNGDDQCNFVPGDYVAEMANYVAEMANTLQESYGNVMRHLIQTYNIQTEVNVWRARFPDFRHTEEERQNHRRLIEDFDIMYQTMRTQYETAMHELTKRGMNENDARNQLGLYYQLRRRPSCAGLSLMLYDTKPKNKNSEVDQTYVYEQIGRKILQSLSNVSEYRLLTADSIKLLLDQGHSNSVYMFLNLSHTWLLASASFLVERLCRSEDDISSVWPKKLNCILPVLLNVIVKLGLCCPDDILRSKDSVGFVMKYFIQREYCAFFLPRSPFRLAKQLHGFLSTTDRKDLCSVGKATVHGLWDIYTKREMSTKNGYEDWELDLKRDAMYHLLKTAFRNGFD